MAKISVKDTQVSVISHNEMDYISLTEMFVILKMVRPLLRNGYEIRIQLNF